MDYFQVIIVMVLLSFKLRNAIRLDPKYAPLVHGKFPWVLKLITSYNNGSMAFCGASLISNEFALTAAHCENNNTISSR